MSCDMLYQVVSVRCCTVMLRGFEMDASQEKRSIVTFSSFTFISLPSLGRSLQESREQHIAVKKNEKDTNTGRDWKRGQTTYQVISRQSSMEMSLVGTSRCLLPRQEFESLGLAQAFWFCADIFTMNPEPGKSK